MKHYSESKIELKNKKWSPKRLYVAAIITNLLHLSTGSVSCWTSPTLPKLDEVLTADEKALVGSLSTLGAALGPLVTALTFDTLGRKKTLNIVALCYLASWAILASSYNPYLMYLGRILGGIGMGGTYTGVAVFIGEIADDERRSSIGSASLIFIGIGTLIQYCIGPYVSYLMLILASALPAVIFIALFYILPESPHYLLKRGEISEATLALSWYRGKANLEVIQEELNEIKVINFSCSSYNDFKESIADNHRGSFKALFLNRGARRALGICLFMVMMPQLSGTYPMMIFAQTIFEKADIKTSAEICSMFIGLATLFPALPAPIIAKKFGLKKALIASGLMTAFSLGLLTLCFIFGSELTNLGVLKFLPVIAAVSSIVFTSFGMGTSPWAFVAQAFSLEVKGIAASFCGVFSCLIGFGAVSASAFILYHIGPVIVFGGFCILLSVCSLIAIFIVPETNGMSLKEIQDIFE